MRRMSVLVVHGSPGGTSKSVTLVTTMVGVAQENILFWK
jgi:hypothetical protein